MLLSAANKQFAVTSKSFPPVENFFTGRFLLTILLQKRKIINITDRTRSRENEF